jgi:hypothetical protein
VIRRSRPPGIRLSTGHRKPDARSKTGWRPDKLFHFQIGWIQVDDSNSWSPVSYPPSRDLAEALYNFLEPEAPPEEWRPTRIPIRLLDDQPFDHGWLEIRLGCWSEHCSSDSIIPGVGTFVRKSREFLETPEQAAALEAQRAASSSRRPSRPRPWRRRELW